MGREIVNARATGLPSVDWANNLEVESIPKTLIQLAALSSVCAARLPGTGTPTTSDVLIDAPALAQLLGCPESHVRTLARSGKIPFTRVGSKYIRFDAAAVRAALAVL